MQNFETPCHLDESLPDLWLVEVGTETEMLIDFFLYVSSISQLHHDAECLSFVIEKCFSVVDYIGVRDRCEYSDLV